MKKNTYLLFILVAFYQVLFAQEKEENSFQFSEWQNVAVTEVNRMPMRASFFAFESQNLAEARKKEKSAFFLNLNGTWKFNWVENPSLRPVDFFKTDFDDSSWANFKVPANWEVNGYGLPIYINHGYEFAGKNKMQGKLNPPYDIPEDNNPVGSYRKKFKLPANWDGKQIFIHLDGVKSAFYIWVNGKKVGYSEDSKLAAEFDITPYVQAGENLVALEVYRWSDGTYLECQDMFRISGIEREVYLYAVPKLDVRDFKVISTLTDNYTNGSFSLSAEVNNYKIDQKTLHSKPDTFSVDIELVDPKGNSVLKRSTAGVQSVLGNYKKTVKFEEKIPNVQPWSAEIPTLYTLYITLKDKAGKVLEVIPQRVGFRSVEIINNNFLVNGKRVFLKGVNRHEHNATQGHTLSLDDMRKDMEMMKKLNVNAVRNSHYPPSSYWMEMCDEYGLYVVDEANIESHGRGYDLSLTFGNDKKWFKAHWDRIYRMYERDKNYPSVVTWSLGNEAGNGCNFYEAYDRLKQIDYRPVQYERAEFDYNTDMIVPQYPSPDWLKEYAHSNPDRLLIISEYAHIMGNSLGNFQEYWDVIENNPNLQGGFIWEWIDQGIDTVKNNKRIIAYGGDFPLEGPVPENISDNNFCVKGVVTAYRKLTPMAVEVKKVYQYVHSEWNNNRLTIKNTYFFRNLNNYRLRWELIQDGSLVESGIINNISVEPQQSVTLDIPMKMNRKAGSEYFLNIRYLLKNAEPLLEAGYEIAYDQFALQSDPVIKPVTIGKGNLDMQEDESGITLKGKDFVVTFDKAQGTMKSFTMKGVNVIEQGPQPSFWRAPTDNDIGAGFNKKFRMWRNAYAEGKLTVQEIKQNTDGSYEINFRKELVNGDAIEDQTFTVYGDGTIKVLNKFTPVKGEYELLMRIGNDLQLNKQFDQINFYGRGPWENYWDRKTGSLVGIYKQEVKDQYFPYARPQESGNKADVRWLTMTNKKGMGIKVVFADSLLCFSALPYSLDDLDPEQDKKQYHSGELIPRDKIYMHIDWQQTGMQGMDSWWAWPLEQYRIKYVPHTYSYYIQLVRK